MASRGGSPARRRLLRVWRGGVPGRQGMDRAGGHAHGVTERIGRTETAAARMVWRRAGTARDGSGR